MIQFDSLIIKKLAVHQVGNKILDEGIQFSIKLADLEDEDLLNVIKRYFLSSFSGNEMYNFYNSVGLEQNEIYTIANKIFAENDVFFDQTKLISKHLYENSNHPKIKNGELFIGYFVDVVYEDKLINAIGIFKSETKENYIKSNVKSKTDIISYDEGSNVNKLNKGCIILNLDKELGYKVCIIDNLGRSHETVYWKENFLSVKPLNNDYHQTNHFLGIAKQFVTKQLDDFLEVSKTDKIDFLNRSVDYFKKNDAFDKQEFEKQVFGDGNVMESFRKFDQTYRQENEFQLSDNFGISEQAVKKQARIFKSVLKLDKNFHIYIHGNKELIERGIDEKGRKYYKIYYENES
ncbi:nucleoid-associated protein [Litoribacter populi]|uniref:nucleoid-associated protein n=1 Tax=Litoribacter populi TaxID=2598460 RepID=UPI00117EFDD8|nr:nucleoid-associated protein [Litoribacter populi]